MSASGAAASSSGAAPRGVAITGLGAVTAAGLGVEALHAALREGRRCFGAVRGFSIAGHQVNLAAEVPLATPELWAELAARAPGGGRLRGPAGGHGWSRSDLLALLAAGEALEGALGRPASPAALAETSVLVGGSTGGMLEAEAWLAGLLDGARTLPDEVQVPLALLCSQPISATADALAEQHRLGGARCTLNTACSSSANALLLGAWLVRSGRACRVLAGGTDALSRLTYAGFAALGLLDPGGCRPFDAARRGLTLGEGAAFVVLEDLAAARARGAAVRGVLLGGALGAEAHHPTQPEPGGLTAARIMTEALADARVGAEAVDYVNAHGTGTPHNDAAEAQAIGRALGAAAAKIPASSSKSMLGHCLAAAGAVEAVATLLALQHGFVPPTAGLERPDPACELGHVTGGAVPADLTVALSNSFGFGGNLTALVLGRAPAGSARP